VIRAAGKKAKPNTNSWALLLFEILYKFSTDYYDT